MRFRPHPSKCPACNGSGKVYLYSGADLRSAREEAGLSLRELARRLDFTAAYLSDIELGRRRVTEAIALAYKDLEAS
jgi:transcriptional regulator with XRE-family HTH domain